MRAQVWDMGLSLRLSSLVPWGLGDRMDRGNEGMRAHVWEMGLSLRLSSLVPWGLWDRMDRGNEGACVGHGAIPESVLYGPLGTRGQDGHRE